MLAFLKFILVLLIGIWFVGLILRATFSRFLRKNAEAYNRAAEQAQREARRKARGQREGEVTIETTETSAAKMVSSDVGDYVEFEEVTAVTASEETDGNKSREE